MPNIDSISRPKNQEGPDLPKSKKGSLLKGRLTLNSLNPLRRLKSLRPSKFFAIKILFALLFVALLGSSAYLAKGYACDRPIRYSIGSLDEKFELKKEDAIALAIESGENWNKASGKNIYIYDASAPLKINFIYDQRQKERDDIKKNLKDLDIEYGSLSELNEKINQLLLEYEKDLSKYNEQINYWNARGGAPTKTFYELDAWRKKLQAQESYINKLITSFDDSQKKYNLTIDTFDQLLEKKRGQIEEEGTYHQNGKNPFINIYVFEGKEELKLLLMHELGHAKTLTHAAGQDSVMNAFASKKQQQEIKPTDEDIKLIKSCKYPF